MPLRIDQTCAKCHETKPRTEFPSRVIGKTSQGWLRRVFSAYCRTCVTADPKLWSAIAVQAEDARRGGGTVV